METKAWNLEYVKGEAAHAEIGFEEANKLVDILNSWMVRIASNLDVADVNSQDQQQIWSFLAFLRISRLWWLLLQKFAMCLNQSVNSQTEWTEKQRTSSEWFLGSDWTADRTTNWVSFAGD